MRDFGFYDRTDDTKWIRVATENFKDGTIKIKAEYEVFEHPWMTNKIFYNGGTYRISDFCPDMVVGNMYVFTGISREGNKFGYAKYAWNKLEDFIELPSYTPFEYTFCILI
jgi:hypothetical protein